ncbi:MAG: hypothetical protein ACOCXQ_04735 [Patescibacteria group bacterium]
MIELLFFGIFLALSSGLIAKVVLDRQNNQYSITWAEYLIVGGFMVFTIGPSVVWLGVNVARDNLLQYKEYWNGYEVSAVAQEYTCTRDGPCVHEYDCDSYRCNPHNCNCRCTSRNKDGRCTSETCSTCYDTCWRDCPYCTKETTYVIQTTIGDVTIAAHRLPVDPHANRWEPHRGRELPQYVIERAGVGAPDLWIQAQERIASGNPGPVTLEKQYENPILASQAQLLIQKSASIQTYLEMGLLPTPSKGTYNHYYATKVYGLGFEPPNAQDWIDANMRLNAALGMDLRGDLHFVVLQDSRVVNPDDYFLSLMAYWQSEEMGKNAISKNSIVVVVQTTDGVTIDWARAATGMPEGNEHMLVELKTQLTGAQLDPMLIFGTPKGVPEFENGQVVDVNPQISNTGILEQVLWGDNAFVRRCMFCDDQDEEGKTSFDFLISQIQPTGWQQFWIIFLNTLLSWVLWGLAIFFVDLRHSRSKTYTRRRC